MAHHETSWLAGSSTGQGRGGKGRGRKESGGNGRRRKGRRGAVCGITPMFLRPHSRAVSGGSDGSLQVAMTTERKASMYLAFQANGSR